jgi:hypothetical protein
MKNIIHIQLSALRSNLDHKNKLEDNEPERDANGDIILDVSTNVHLRHMMDIIRPEPYRRKTKPKKPSVAQ